MLTNEFSDEIDEKIKAKHAHICEKLDISGSVMDASWDIYKTIRNDHNLEVSLGGMRYEEQKRQMDGWPVGRPDEI